MSLFTGPGQGLGCCSLQRTFTECCWNRRTSVLHFGLQDCKNASRPMAGHPTESLVLCGCSVSLKKISLGVKESLPCIRRHLKTMTSSLLLLLLMLLQHRWGSLGLTEVGPISLPTGELLDPRRDLLDGTPAHRVLCLFPRPVVLPRRQSSSFKSPRPQALYSQRSNVLPATPATWASSSCVLLRSIAVPWHCCWWVS